MDKSTGFAYFCWQRQARAGDMPPGMRWENFRLSGTPTLCGKYLLKIPGTDIDFTMTVVRPRDSAGIDNGREP